MKSAAMGGITAATVLVLLAATAHAQGADAAIIERQPPGTASASDIAVRGLGNGAEDNGTYLVIRDQVYVERPSGPLQADIYVPQGEGPFPGMLVVHGGAWASGSKSQLAFVAARLAVRGYTAMAISYRLAPQHKFPAQVHDCKAAVRWLRTNAETFNVDPQRIGGFGYSAGGHLVALLGATSPADGLEDAAADQVQRGGAGSVPALDSRLQVVVAGGAPCNFLFVPEEGRGLSFWLGARRGERPDVYDRASPVTYVSPDDPPMFFFHGENDDLVPIASPRRMVEALSAAGVSAELYEIQRGGHVTSTFHLGAIERAEAFAARYLKPAPAPEVGARISEASSQRDGRSDGQ